MSWKIRHEGSPTAVELTEEQLHVGLLDGHWESTDEVMGPNDRDWVAIENHPALADVAAEMEPPPPRTYDDETRLDMNALIDVCLVLLVFFILTTTVAVLQKRLEAPSVEEGKAKVAVFTKAQVANQMIHVKATREGEATVIRLEDQVVDPDRLIAEFRRFVRSTGKTTLLLEHDDKVSQDTVVKIIDAAKGAGMDRVRLLVP